MIGFFEYPIDVFLHVDIIPLFQRHGYVEVVTVWHVNTRSGSVFSMTTKS